MFLSCMKLCGISFWWNMCIVCVSYSVCACVLHVLYMLKMYTNSNIQCGIARCDMGNLYKYIYWFYEHTCHDMFVQVLHWLANILQGINSIQTMVSIDLINLLIKYQLESVWLGSKGSVMPNRPSCDLCMAGNAPLSCLGQRGGQRKERRGGRTVVWSYRCCWWFWFWKLRWQEASQTKDSKEAQAIFLQRKCQRNFVEQWVFGWGAQILAMQNWLMLLM